MKFLVTGANGQLGRDVMRALVLHGASAVGVGRADADITDADAVHALISRVRPDVVIHSAAYTAVDRAEEQRELCRATNEDGTRNVARAADACDASMVYISTDYVFDGQGTLPFSEDAITAPINWYGITKEAGERAVRETCVNAWILRTAWAFGLTGRNFVQTMLRLGREKPELRVVADQIGSPTYTADLAEAIVGLTMGHAPYGNYHATNEGFVSWCDFARAILRCAAIDTPVAAIPSSAYTVAAKRPHNSRLSKRKLAALGLSLPPWEDALRRYLREAGYGL